MRVANVLARAARVRHRPSERLQELHETVLLEYTYALMIVIGPVLAAAAS